MQTGKWCCDKTLPYATGWRSSLGRREQLISATSSRGGIFVFETSCGAAIGHWLRRTLQRTATPRGKRLKLNKAAARRTFAVMTDQNSSSHSDLSSSANRRITADIVFPLSEGSFTIDKTKMFVPFIETEHQLNERPTGSLLVEIQPFLVKTSKDLLLLDCGLGYTLPSGSLQLHENIRKAGFQPEDVTKVLLSHLHKDHAGGIGNPQTGRFAGGHDLNLPNALYYVQRRELDYAWQTGGPSFLMDELEPLVHSPQVVFLHEDHGFIDDYIEFRHSGGHSPFHQVFWIHDAGQTIFFGGDECPQLSQMKVRYKTKYDFDPEKALQLRQQFWAEGCAKGWTFLFYHDIKHPTYTAL